jgi:hypothetical protein
MKVIVLLCVSLGSSTIQLHGSLGSKRACVCSGAGFSSQNGDRAWGVNYRRAAFCCAFFFVGKKDSMQRIFIKKCYLLTEESTSSVNRFIIGWQKFRWWRRGWIGGAEVAETTAKRLLRCGFRRTSKAMGQVYQCYWRICREINAFSRFEYHVILFICICDLFTDFSSYIRGV